MKPAAAIDELEALISSREQLSQEPAYLEWTAKAAAILRASFGADSDQVRQFVEAAAVKRKGYTLAGSPARDREAWRGDASHRAKAVLKAAVFTLRTVTSEDSPLDEASIDPELWGHVQGLVLGNDWSMNTS